jgi:hypothetical protein
MSRKPTLCIGPLSPKGQGRHWIEPPLNLPPPQTITNATSTAPLDLTRLWANSAQRPGCNDFLKHRSRGLGC